MEAIKASKLDSDGLDKRMTMERKIVIRTLTIVLKVVYVRAVALDKKGFYLKL